MTLILKQIFNLLKLLNSDTGLYSLSAGVSLGFVLGMSPLLSLQGIFILFIAFFFRIQLGAMFVSAFFFAFMAWVLDPIFHQVGNSLLTNPALESLWITLFNAPLVPLTRFNNTIILGAGVVSILLTPFIFLLSKVLIQKYRQTVVERFKQTKIWKVVKATSLYKWYYKYDNLYG